MQTTVPEQSAAAQNTTATQLSPSSGNAESPVMQLFLNTAGTQQQTIEDRTNQNSENRIRSKRNWEKIASKICYRVSLILAIINVGIVHLFSQEAQASNNSVSPDRTILTNINTEDSITYKDSIALGLFWASWILSVLGLALAALAMISKCRQRDPTLQLLLIANPPGVAASEHANLNSLTTDPGRANRFAPEIIISAITAMLLIATLVIKLYLEGKLAAEADFLLLFAAVPDLFSELAKKANPYCFGQREDATRRRALAFAQLYPAVPPPGWNNRELQELLLAQG